MRKETTWQAEWSIVLSVDKRNWRGGLFSVVGWVGMPGLAATPRHPKLE
jgi:hypothetical protein